MSWPSMLLTLTLTVSMTHSSYCFPAQDGQDFQNQPDSAVHIRNKRDVYVTMQDRAQAVCLGMCMFSEKKTYYRCENRCKVGIPRQNPTESNRRRKKAAN